MIRTLRGDLKKEELGFTLPHEHILIDMQNCVDEMPHEEFHGKITPSNRYLMVSDPYYICENAAYTDEDEAVAFLTAKHKSCPYYRFYDEYKSVQKQI